MQKSLNTGTSTRTRQITVIGMLSAISIMLGLTGLGFIPIPPVKATIMHIPVIIGAILEGPIVGASVGLIFGVFSMIQAITAPTPLSFIFMNPVVAVIPRVLIGIVSYYIYKGISRKNKNLGTAVAAGIGSLTNTAGVLGLIYLIYLEPYAKTLGISVSAAKKGILVVGATNGIPEAIISIIITMAVATAVKKISRR